MAQRGPRNAYVTLFDLLSICHSPVRVELLLTLGARPRYVAELAGRRQLQASHVSRFLQPLADASLLRAERQGHRQVYSLGPQASIHEHDGLVVVCLRADDGSGLDLKLPPQLAQELAREPTDNTRFIGVVRDEPRTTCAPKFSSPRSLSGR